jgi:2-deoxy-D-gluconate 3-dehydrogenase
MKLFDLHGRVAIVSGGNGGIGLGMARGLGEAGASVVLVGRDQGKGERAVRALQATNIQSAFVSADVTREADCQRAVDNATSKFGGVDILINGAGIAIRKQPQDYSIEEWNAVISTNLTSAFLLSRAVYPVMKSRGGGKIINIGSIFSVVGAPFAVAYCASKGGIVQVTKSLATAWAENNIQVNAILPGWTDTDLTVTARREVSGLEDLVMARTPAKRWGRTEDFAGVAIFLASEASNFVTGASLLVDGGFTATA